MKIIVKYSIVFLKNCYYRKISSKKINYLKYFTHFTKNDLFSSQNNFYNKKIEIFNKNIFKLVFIRTHIVGQSIRIKIFFLVLSLEMKNDMKIFYIHRSYSKMTISLNNLFYKCQIFIFWLKN
jgi:hypothetical protein